MSSHPVKGDVVEDPMKEEIVENEVSAGLAETGDAEPTEQPTSADEDHPLIVALTELLQARPQTSASIGKFVVAVNALPDEFETSRLVVRRILGFVNNLHRGFMHGSKQWVDAEDTKFGFNYIALLGTLQSQPYLIATESRRLHCYLVDAATKTSEVASKHARRTLALEPEAELGGLLRAVRQVQEFKEVTDKFLGKPEKSRRKKKIIAPAEEDIDEEGEDLDEAGKKGRGRARVRARRGRGKGKENGWGGGRREEEEEGAEDTAAGTPENGSLVGEAVRA